MGTERREPTYQPSRALREAALRVVKAAYAAGAADAADAAVIAAEAANAVYVAVNAAADAAYAAANAAGQNRGINPMAVRAYAAGNAAGHAANATVNARTNAAARHADERAVMALRAAEKALLWTAEVRGDKALARERRRRWSLTALRAGLPGAGSRCLVQVACRLLPGGARERYREEWTGQLAELGTRRARARFAMSLAVCGAARLAGILRRKDPGHRAVW